MLVPPDLEITARSAGLRHDYTYALSMLLRRQVNVFPGALDSAHAVRPQRVIVDLGMAHQTERRSPIRLYYPDIGFRYGAPKSSQSPRPQPA
jgi:hypothetical protein